MSFTTTIMFERPIWGFDVEPETVAAARRAGWTRADLLWEQMQERANAAFLAGDSGKAARLFRIAHWVGVTRFPRSDLRRVTSLANLGVIDRLRGRSGPAQTKFTKALANWSKHADRAVETMQIAPRARSSLFHMRMEALHRETYQDNMKIRIGRFTQETRSSIEAYLNGGVPSHRHFDQWNGEKPAIFDDTRKILSACLFLATQ